MSDLSAPTARGIPQHPAALSSLNDSSGIAALLRLARRCGKPLLATATIYQTRLEGGG